MHACAVPPKGHCVTNLGSDVWELHQRRVGIVGEAPVLDLGCITAILQALKDKSCGKQTSLVYDAIFVCEDAIMPAAARLTCQQMPRRQT